MGNPLSPILSDIYMYYYERKLFEQIQFLFWIRYVDDTFVLWHKSIEDIPEITNVLNSIDDNIQFTYEIEVDGKLPFLDVLIHRKSNKFETSIYRKPFSVNLPPHKNSNHPNQQKISSFMYFINRAKEICSTQEALETELTYLKNVAINRGYNSNIIDKCFKKLQKPTSKSKKEINVESNKAIVVLPFVEASRRMAPYLKKFGFEIIYKPVLKLQFSMVKDKIPIENLSGIYKIPCNCGKVYIGQTKRSLKFRIKEHQNNVKNCNIEKSSIAQHSWSNSNHQFNFKSAELLQKPNDISQLNFLEAWEIQKNKAIVVNNVEIVPHLSDAWKHVIDILFSK